MFLLQQILRCGRGRQREAVKRLNWIHSQMTEHPGAAGMMVAKYLGNPFDLLILRQWKDRAAFDDFMASPAGDFPKSKPAGIYDSLDISHNWEEVIHTDGNSPAGDFIWRSQYHVPSDRWDEFLRLRQDDDKLAQWYQLAERHGSAFGALVSAQTFRNLDNHEGALVITRLQNREAMEDIVASPSRSTIESAISRGDLHPGTARAPRGPLFSDCFEIVDEFAAR